MFNIIDNKTASNNRNTAAATVTFTPFTKIPAKVDDILPYMTAPAAFDIGVQTAQWLKAFVSANKLPWTHGPGEHSFIGIGGERCWSKSLFVKRWGWIDSFTQSLLS